MTVQVSANAAQASGQNNQASNEFSVTVTVQSACVTGGAVPAGDEYAGPGPRLRDPAGVCTTMLVGTATLAPAWSVTTPIDDWDGIGIATGSMRVTHLGLAHRNLDGSLPPELGDLSEFVSITLDGNDLSGEIPGELGVLEKLESLSLNSNEITGTIPTELGSLTKVTKLFLAHNQLSGSIPASLGSMAALKELTLHYNQLTGRYQMR